ncbi:MAG: cupin domain-containing protein [Chitinophagaceae bacterium]
MGNPAALIEQYQLEPHPEGGWYRQTYKSPEMIQASGLPARFGGDRPFSTAIFFLLEQGNFSAFHRIQSDECWHFYDGDPLEIYMLKQGDILETIILGRQPEKGQLFQFVVPAGCWFASRPAKNSAYCFTGCTVSPGFDFADFELADGETLSHIYPKHAELIRELCR